MTISSSVSQCMNTKLDNVKDNTGTKVNHKNDKNDFLYNDDFMEMLLKATSTHDSAPISSASPHFQKSLFETSSFTTQGNNISLNTPSQPLKSAKHSLSVYAPSNTPTPSQNTQEKTTEPSREQDPLKVSPVKEEKLENKEKKQNIEKKQITEAKRDNIEKFKNVKNDKDSNSLKITSKIETISKIKSLEIQGIKTAETTRMENSSDSQVIIAPPSEKLDLSLNLSVPHPQQQIALQTKTESMPVSLPQLSQNIDLNIENQLTQWIQNGQVEIINLNTKIKVDSLPIGPETVSFFEDLPTPSVTEILPESAETKLSPPSKLMPINISNNTDRAETQPLIHQMNHITSPKTEPNLEIAREQILPPTINTEQQERALPENASPQVPLSKTPENKIKESSEKNAIRLETHQQNSFFQDHGQDNLPKVQQLIPIVQQQNSSPQDHPQDNMPNVQQLAPITSQQNSSSQGQTQDNIPKPQQLTPIVQQQNTTQEGNLKSEIVKTGPFSLTEASKGTTPTTKQIPLTSPKLTATLQQKIEAIQLVKNQMKETLQKGETHLLIKLSPDDLGKINLKLDITKDGTLVALFKSDSQETITLLKNHETDFRQLFRDAGINMDASTMQFSHSGQQTPYDKNISSNQLKNKGNENVLEETSETILPSRVVGSFIPSTHNKTLNIQV